MLRLIAQRYLTLRDKRALMQVSKACYWWIHPYIRVFTVPKSGEFRPDPCIAALHDAQKSTLRRKLKATLASDEGGRSTSMECGYGHRFPCHYSDFEPAKGVFESRLGPCPTCGRAMRPNKRIKR